MEKKLKLGIIGAGEFAAGTHYPIWSSFDDVDLLAVCDLDEARRNEQGDKYKIPHRFDSAEKMLDSVDLDGVVICVRPKSLFSLAMPILCRKKHVFMEKPPGMTALEAQEMALAAQAHNCHAQAGFNRRFSHVLRYARDKVLERGTPASCHASYNKYCFGEPLFNTGDNLLSDGIHAIDTLVYLSNSVPVKVYPYSHKGADGFPSRYAAMIEFENGCVGTYTGNYHAGVRHESFEIHSDGVSGYISAPDKAEIFVENSEFVRPRGEIVTDMSLAGTEDRLISYGYNAAMRHFVDVALGKRTAEVTLKEAVAVMEVVEAIQKTY